MKNVIDTLNRYYDSFISQPNDWHFFLGLADYVNFVLETPQTKKIADSIIQKRFDEEALLEKRSKEAIKEINQVKGKLIKKIKDKKISYQGLDNLIREYEDYEKGRIIASSQPMADNLAVSLEDIIDSLYKNGYQDLVKDLVVPHSQDPKIIRRYNYSKTIPLFREQFNKIDKQREIEIWGAWNYLFLASMVIHKGEEVFENLKKDKGDFLKAFNFTGLWGEMKHIREKGKGRGNYNASDKPTYFVKDNYISYASRIHNYLIKELNSQIVKIPRLIQPSRIEPNMTAETVEFNRKIEEAGRWQAEQRQAERLHRERMKQDRILRTPVDKYTHALDLIIERAECAGNGKNISIEYYDFNFPDRMDDLRVLTHFLEKLQTKKCFESYGKTNYAGGTRLSFIKPNIKNLKKFREKETDQKPKTITAKDKTEIPKFFEVEIKDREIWINDYFLSKPHAIGSNFEFFYHIRGQKANEVIKREGLPDWLKKEISNKGFIKILNAIGFKSEILKAFFPKRGKSRLVYRGNKITKNELQKSGIKIPLLLKELELAHIKNSPE
jgi:hypothetical protein